MSRHRAWLTRDNIARFVIVSSPFVDSAAVTLDRYLILGIIHSPVTLCNMLQHVIDKIAGTLGGVRV